MKTNILDKYTKLISIIVLISHTLQIRLKSPYDLPNTKDAINGIIKLGFRKGSFQTDLTPFSVCVKKLSIDESQHDRCVETFWSKVSENFGKTMKVAIPLEKNDFIGLFSCYSETPKDSVLVDGVQKPCREILINGVMDDKSLASLKGQMQDLAIPCFAYKMTLQPKTKDFITAFNGVHYGQAPNQRSLVNKLNSRS